MLPGPETEAQIPGGTSAELHCCCLLLLGAARGVEGTSRHFTVPGVVRAPTRAFALFKVPTSNKHFDV